MNMAEKIFGSYVGIYLGYKDISKLLKGSEYEWDGHPILPKIIFSDGSTVTTYGGEIVCINDDYS